MNSEDEYDGEISPVHKQLKSQLTDTVSILNEENKRLRRDNGRLRKLRSVNEGILVKHFSLNIN